MGRLSIAGESGGVERKGRLSKRKRGILHFRVALAAGDASDDPDGGFSGLAIVVGVGRTAVCRVSNREHE